MSRPSPVADRPAPPAAVGGRAPLLNRLILVAALGAAAAAGWQGWRAWDRASPQATGPFVVVSIDSLRVDRVSAYGSGPVRTPALDSLAADGVLFEQAWAHVPQTLPAHVSLLSGLLPFEHGVRHEAGFVVGPEIPLIQEEFRGLGYATGGVVSSFLLRSATGLARGFDLYDDRVPDPLDGGQSHRAGHASLAAARHWLARQDSPRFLLFLHLDEPRSPPGPAPSEGLGAAYDVRVAEADRVLAQLLEDLRARGWYDAATLVVLADHGESLGDHGETGHGIFLYASTMRIPFVVKPPGGRARGRRSIVPVQPVDLRPTLLDLAGAPIPLGLHGRSLRPILESPRGLIADRDVYGESLWGRYVFGWSELHSLTDDQFRFIKAPREELYDLRNDPADRVDVIARRALTSAVMRDRLDRLLAGSRIASPDAVPIETRRRLHALGLPPTIADIDLGAPGEDLPDPKDEVAAGRSSPLPRVSPRQPASGSQGRGPGPLEADPSALEIFEPPRQFVDVPRHRPDPAPERPDVAEQDDPDHTVGGQHERRGG